MRIKTMSLYPIGLSIRKTSISKNRTAKKQGRNKILLFDESVSVFDLSLFVQKLGNPSLRNQMGKDMG